MSSLREKLTAGQFAVTAEIVPPATADPARLLAKAEPLAAWVDAINITDGAGARAHLDALTAAGVLVRAGIEPVLQLTCRDRNRIALQSLLLGAAAQGVHNVLVLSGDDPSAGDQPEAKPVFDLDSARLLATARAMRDQQSLPSGRQIEGRIELFLGCADRVIDPSPEWAPRDLLRKIEAGAQFVQTQFCLDADVARRYLERLEMHGVTRRASILIGVAPLASARSARWIRAHLPGAIVPDSVIERLEAAADPKLEGHRMCLSLMDELRRIPGVAGVHLMAPANESALPAILAEFRAGTARAGSHP